MMAMRCGIAFAALLIHLVLAAGDVSAAGDSHPAALATALADYRRPATTPFPDDDPYSKAKADLGRYKFTRHAVVGSAIVDFNCHHLGLALDIDEVGEDEVLARRRDKSLEAVGIRVMRIAAADVLGNIDDVLARITVAMRERIADKKEAARAHREANPNQHYSRPNRRKFDA